MFSTRKRIHMAYVFNRGDITPGIDCVSELEVLEPLIIARI